MHHQHSSLSKMAVALILALCSLATANPATRSDVLLQEWEAFKTEHGKKYPNSSEESFRLKVYLKNRREITLHNQKAALGLVSYTLGMNQFGDMLHPEFVQLMTRSLTDSSERSTFSSPSTSLEPLKTELPDSVDWREHGYVTPVRDQGPCGSSWAFSATGSLEGQNFRKTGKLVSLSEQNLIDCSREFGNEGCDGGLMSQAFDYISSNGGINKEEDYPYEAREGECRYSASKVGAKIANYVNLTSGSEEQLMQAIATVGPISVAIDASHESLMSYRGGVYYEPSCSSETNHLNHAVLVVGYGSDSSGQQHYIVKNSWGEKWGDNGYILMARDGNNNCGIATEALYPTVQIASSNYHPHPAAQINLILLWSTNLHHSIPTEPPVHSS